jgi:hypothetical protein
MVAAHGIHRQGEGSLPAGHNGLAAGSGRVSHDQAPASWTKTFAVAARQARTTPLVFSAATTSRPS